jgi:hypothetical protein
MNDTDEEPLYTWNTVVSLAHNCIVAADKENDFKIQKQKLELKVAEVIVYDQVHDGGEKYENFQVYSKDRCVQTRFNLSTFTNLGSRNC